MRPYRRKRASCHSCDPSSVPFTVDGFTVSQAPLFVARCSRRACRTGTPSSAAVSVSSACHCLLRLTAVRPSRRKAEWSILQNSTWPLNAAMRCPVMIKDVVQFLGAVWDGSVKDNPDCLTGRRVTPLSGTPSPSPSKKLRHKGLLQRRLHRAEGVADSLGHPLHKCPLLLE